MKKDQINSKKHLLFLITSLSGGGAEKVLIDLLKSIDKQLYKVTLCVLFREGEYFAEIPKDVELVVLFKKRGSLYRKSFRYYYKKNNPWLLSLLIRCKLKRSYHAIISFLEGYPLFFHTFITDWSERNIAWVHCDLLHHHYTLLGGFFDVKSEEQAYAQMDTVVFVSKSAMNNFKQLYSLDTPMRCIYNMIDVDNIRLRSQSYLEKNNRLTIIAIGRLVNLKGFDKIIRVSKRLKDAGYDLSFQFIGQGEEEEALLSLRNSLGLQQEISFLGFQKNPYPYMRNADILLNASSSEGLPLVICEAFALSLPVVATKTSGAIELLADGEYGVLTECDEQSIYCAVKQLIDNEEERAYYARQSEIRSKIFNIKDTLEEIYSLF